MDRLTRQPCEHCGKDTLFKAITCTECGTIKNIGEGFRAKKTRVIGKLVARYGREYGAAVSVLGFKEDLIGRQKEQMERGRRWRGSVIGMRGGSVFGSGRQRTKV